jgi:Holliday junction resolvasome RuvABC DNA-binding subunit
LVGLGYSPREADAAVESIAGDPAAADADVTALLRAALRTLSRS